MYRSVIPLLFAPTLVIAGNPLECVDPEFIRAFLSGSNSSPVSYSTEMPEHFEVQELPSDMRLVGSRKKKSSTTVIFRTSEGVREAYSGLANVLSEQGWKDITLDQNPRSRGFQLADSPVVANYCRETGDTRLAVRVSERSGQSFVSLQQYVQKTLRGCSSMMRERRRDLLDSLPVLNPPDGAKTSNVRQLTNINEVSTSVDISTVISRKELLDFFGDQILGQDWTFQTKWLSKVSSGSVWSRNASEHGILVGTLHLYGAGSDPVRVRFSIDFADPSKDIDHGISAQSSGGCN